MPAENAQALDRSVVETFGHERQLYAQKLLKRIRVKLCLILYLADYAGNLFVNYC